MTKKPRPKPSEIERVAALPPPTAETAAAIAEARASASKRPERVQFSEESDQGSLSIAPGHSDVDGWRDHLFASMGTSSGDFVSSVYGRLELMLRPRGEGQRAKLSDLNATMAMIGGIGPTNELETMLAEQIISSHLLAMSATAKAHHADTVPKMEAYITMATKLSRTMATQVETLTKLRSGGKQQVVVKHVYINGNAVVGDGNQAILHGGPGGGQLPRSEQSHATDLLDASSAALLCTDALGHPLPLASGQEQEAVSDARRD